MSSLDINKLYMELVKQALKDGVISSDENQILAESNSRLKDFKQVFDDAMSDGVISQTERDMLYRFRDEAISKVRGVGLADGVLSSEEESLLRVLSELISREIDRKVDIRRSFQAVVDI